MIPAAGTGSRLGAGVPKLLVPVNGRPMICHLLALYSGVAERATVVVSPTAVSPVTEVLRAAALPVSVAVQEQPTGMLDAILRAEPSVRAVAPRRVLITWCDQIAITPATVRRVVGAAAAVPEPAMVMPTCVKPAPYVHLERDSSGRVVRVLHRREGDAMPAVGETDAGVFDLSAAAFLEWLPEYAARPEIGARTGERNFVPFAASVAARGGLATVACVEPEETIGINTPDELAQLAAHLRSRKTP